MHEIFSNVNEALPELFDIVTSIGEEMPSRNGPVFSLTEPIYVTIENPVERVLLCPGRRANPFLFLVDGLSILTSNTSVLPMARMVKRFADYSDDGVTLRGHYGGRLRPQLLPAIDMLRKEPSTRRVAMNIWDHFLDLGVDSKDIPCNVMVIPRIVERKTGQELDLTVINRSNDLFWGMMGANVVQFSFLQEFMAEALDCQVGLLNQISTNLHVYTGFGPGKEIADGKMELSDPNKLYMYEGGEYPPVQRINFASTPEAFLKAVDNWFACMAGDDPMVFPATDEPFLNDVVYPMHRVWHTKELQHLDIYPDCDWFRAARMFLGKKS